MNTNGLNKLYNVWCSHKKEIYKAIDKKYSINDLQQLVIIKGAKSQVVFLLYTLYCTSELLSEQLKSNQVQLMKSS